MEVIDLNEIEKRFHEAFESYEDEVKSEELSIYDLEEKFEALPCCYLGNSVVIGPYKVDFVYDKCVIEIDGHEHHKTKEQRDYDYKRERYLQMQGYVVVRFTGTEVFLEPRKCVIEMLKINDIFEGKIIDAYEEGLHFGQKEYEEYLNS